MNGAGLPGMLRWLRALHREGQRGDERVVGEAVDARAFGADVGPADYWEPYASITGQFGPVAAKLGVAYAWDQDSLGDSDNFYIYTNLDAAIPNSPVTVSAHLGYTDGVLAPPLLAGTGDDSGFDWSLGGSVTVLPGLSIGGAYIGTEGPSIDGFTDDTFVATLTFAM